LKLVKRTLQIISVLVIVGIGYFLVVKNSEYFATDIAYLECTIDEANEEFFDNFVNALGLVSYVRLQKDHIKNQVLATWIDIDGDSDTGTRKTRRLDISSISYSSKKNDFYVSFDRQTLRYKWSAGTREDKKLWYERSCVKTTKQVYETARQKEVNRVKSNQNI
tara:strand:+ start:20 stop:511 length:492 start_codon:yes stop_codon:yes gene_type:complete